MSTQPRVTAAFMRPRLSRWFALGFGSGLSPIMPGTVGTLWAWLVFRLGATALGPTIAWLVIAFSLVVGVWACERCGQDLGVRDHGAMVWDEIVAFWIVLMFVPATWGWQCAAFFAFRFFDMVKPPPIGWLDRHLKGGIGVMADDLAAAAFSLVLLAFFR